MADVGEVEDGGGADEDALHLADDGGAARDDGFGEMVADGDAIVAHVERRVAVADECGEGRDMDEPSAAGDEVVAIAGAEADVDDAEPRFVSLVAHGLLCLSCQGQQETACRATLDVALREGGGIGKTATVQRIVGTEVERAERQHVGGQRHAFLALGLIPAGEVLGVLIGQFGAPAVAIGAEVELVIAVASHELGRVEGEAEADAQIVDRGAERGLAVGTHHLCEAGALLHAVDFNPGARDVQASGHGPFGGGAHDVERVDVGPAIALREDAVGILERAVPLAASGLNAGGEAYEQK